MNKKEALIQKLKSVIDNPEKPAVEKTSKRNS